jgi:ubiquinone/menaquinone biosynthesis C-methylase UbiE
VTFAVSAEVYRRFMGRFSEPLADELVRLLDPRPRTTALDVGCGPGALTSRLVGVLGEDAVWAVDPQEAFVDAVREQWPAVHASVSAAESLPFEDDHFDTTAAELVVHFMSDPVAGVREMRRVTRPGGAVAACVWDLAGAHSPLSDFWAAARTLDPDVTTEAGLPGAREGHLAEIFEQAGLEDLESAVLTVSVRFETFEEWWQPFTFGVGPAGAHVAAQDDAGREAIRDACARRFGPAPFDVVGKAWTVVARA